MQQYRFRKLPLIFLLISILTMLIVATGCGGVAASASSPAAGPTPTPNADAAHVSSSPTSIDFGSVAVGSQKTTTLTVTNTKGTAANVTQIKISGSGFSYTSNSSVPFKLAAGQSATLTVTFTPVTAGTATGSLSVSISGGASPAPTSLTGTGLASGQLGISPASMNFGTVAVGTPVSQKGSLTAAGSSITVSSASWNGAGYSLSGITFPVTVPAGQSVPYTVTFNPQTAGASNGTLSFISNASNSPTSETLSGSGASSHSVALSWTASTSSVVGYNVYRGTQTGGPYTRINASVDTGTTFTDTNVTAGATYFYVVTSVDSSSQESTYSNEASAVIPTP